MASQLLISVDLQRSEPGPQTMLPCTRAYNFQEDPKVKHCATNRISASGACSGIE